MYAIYWITGIISIIFQISLFWVLLYGFSWTPILADLISISASMTVSFLMDLEWTFKSLEKD